MSRRLALGGVVALYLGSASSLVWYAPQWLSYYNLAIGGLPGATAMGMEPTYYWDGLDRGVLDWLDRHTGPGEKVRFAAASTENLAIMQRWGTLPVEFRADAPGTYRWYVVQHRPSGMWPADHWLVRNGRPAFRKTIRAGGWGPWRLDVPLVEVYSYKQYLLALNQHRKSTATTNSTAIGSRVADPAGWATGESSSASSSDPTKSPRADPATSATTRIFAPLLWNRQEKTLLPRPKSNRAGIPSTVKKS